MITSYLMSGNEVIFDFDVKGFNVYINSAKGVVKIKDIESNTIKTEELPRILVEDNYNKNLGCLFTDTVLKIIEGFCEKESNDDLVKHYECDECRKLGIIDCKNGDLTYGELICLIENYEKSEFEYIIIHESFHNTDNDISGSLRSMGYRDTQWPEIDVLNGNRYFTIEHMTKRSRAEFNERQKYNSYMKKGTLAYSERSAKGDYSIFDHFKYWRMSKSIKIG